MRPYLKKRDEQIQKESEQQFKKSNTGDEPTEPAKSPMKKQLRKLKKEGPSPRATLQEKEPEEEFEQGKDEKVSEDEDLWKE